MDALDSLMGMVLSIQIFISTIYNSSKLDEVAKNVSAATEHVNNISSQSSQLKLQLSKTQELYSPETSSALKETAENLLNLITSNAKENVDLHATPTPFLEFVSSFSNVFFNKKFS